MATSIDPFSGNTRFWCRAPGYPQAHLQMPDSYGNIWKASNETIKCVCVTTGDGEVSQLGVELWDGKIFLAKGLPGFLCANGVEPEDLIIFSFDDFRDLRVGVFSLLGDEFNLNQGGNVMYNPSGNQPPPDITSTYSPNSPTPSSATGNVICPSPATRVPVCRSGKITLDHQATTEPYILEIPMDFAENNLPRGDSEVQLNVEGDTNWRRIHCIRGPKRAIATMGWSNFVIDAKLKAGHIFSFYKNPAYADMWNVTLSRASNLA